MNKEKSKALWIGASSNYKNKPYGLKWTNGLVKSLGTYIGTDLIRMIDVNFNERLKKWKPDRYVVSTKTDFKR